MIRGLVCKFTKNICEYNNFSTEKQEEIEYSLLITVFEILKIIITVFIFSMLGFFKQIVLIVLVMLLTKPFIGGYHENTQLKCLIATIIISGSIIYISINNKLDFTSLVLLNVLNIFAIYNRAPVINNDMPITRIDLINKNKIIGVVSSIVFFIIALVLHNKGIYSSIITWTLLVEVCLMFNKKTNENKGE